jgi:hypothetical protein
MMTSYVSGPPTAGGLPAEQMGVLELRVISNLLQAQNGNQAIDELNVLRNDQAQELSITQPVPGTGT